MLTNSPGSPSHGQHLDGDMLNEVLKKLAEIAKAANNGDFVFRGEPKQYEEISSGLYREYRKQLGPFGLRGFDLRHVQEEILEDAGTFVGDVDPHDLLSQLQHFGLPTNLIDFTTDYLIALYFACSSEMREDGRIILLEGARAPLYKMRSPENRIKAQKSVFVNPREGTITPDKIVLIPSQLKFPILYYLMRNHDISDRTIFDDIHGFIRNANIHRSAYVEFHMGRLHMTQENPQVALRHFDNSIAMNGARAPSYVNRGLAYFMLGRYDEAISDFTRAIELDPNEADLFLKRGLARYNNEQTELADEDLSEAIRLDPQLVDAYEVRAMTRADLNDSQGAIEDLDHTVRLDPKRKTAFNSRGLAHWITGNPQSALNDFNKAIELDPTNPIPHFNRGNFLFQEQRFNEAIENYTTLIEIGEGDIASTYFRRGMAQLVLQRVEEARADLRTALSIEPEVASRLFDSSEGVRDLLKNPEGSEKLPQDLIDMLMPSGRD